MIVTVLEECDNWLVPWKTAYPTIEAAHRAVAKAIDDDDLDISWSQDGTVGHTAGPMFRLTVVTMAVDETS